MIFIGKITLLESIPCGHLDYTGFYLAACTYSGYRQALPAGAGVHLLSWSPPTSCSRLSPSKQRATSSNLFHPAPAGNPDPGPSATASAAFP